MDELRRTNGISGADLLKKALDAESPMLEKTRNSAYAQGFDAARKKFATVFPCAGCGEPIEVTSDRVRAAIRQSLKEGGWGHGECVRG